MMTLRHVALSLVVILSITACLPAQSRMLGGVSDDERADVIEAAMPSVVAIEVEKIAPDEDEEEDSFPFQRRQPMPRIPGMPSPNAMGTGFVLDTRRHIVTNNHVIANSDRIRVILQDGRKIPARLVGRDERTDVAVIRVDDDVTLRPARFADSERVRVGNTAIAIGTPFGLGQTVTMGIISAKNREIAGNIFSPFLQTDAAINQGNSGGPLLNRSGDVIGMNTAIYSRSGGSIGIGFAVPSNLVRSIAERLIEGGSIRRGWLGVSLRDDAEIKGALIINVDAQGPSKDAIKAQDRVIGVNGSAINNTRDLRTAIANLVPGATVRIEVIRDGRTLTVEVKLGEAPQEARPQPKPTERPRPVTVLDTFVVRELMDNEKFSPELPGLRVVDILDLRYAFAVRTGDIIVAVDEKDMNTPSDLEEALKGTGMVALSIVRRGSLMITVEVPKVEATDDVPVERREEAPSRIP
jgi:serine protease Do